LSEMLSSSGSLFGTGVAAADYGNEFSIMAARHLATHGSRGNMYRIGAQASGRE
jgi:hypothetical protein